MRSENHYQPEINEIYHLRDKNILWFIPLFLHHSFICTGLILNSLLYGGSCDVVLYSFSVWNDFIWSVRFVEWSECV